MNTTVVLIVIIVAVVLFTIISLHNRIVSCKNGAERAWASVIAYERQKNEVLPRLEELSAQYQAYEKSLQEKIVALRNSLGQLDANAIDTDQLGQTERHFNDLMQTLRVTVEQYPDLKAADVVKQYMATITAQQEDVAAAIVIFNRAVKLHNDAIETFPGNLINEKFNQREPIKPFDNAEAASGLGYTPNI